nr:hypothetical protein [Nocardioides houyundeii]
MTRRLKMATPSAAATSAGSSTIAASVAAGLRNGSHHSGISPPA